MKDFLSIAWPLSWIAATTAAFLLGVHRAIESKGPVLHKWLIALACLATWLVLQAFAFVWAFMLIYCENCADKPARPEDYLSALVFSLPTALALGVLLVLRLRSHPTPRPEGP